MAILSANVPWVAAKVPAAIAVAMASTPQSTMSSNTATPNIRLAKRVWRIFRS